MESTDEVLQEAAAGCIGNIRRLALANEKARYKWKVCALHISYLRSDYLCRYNKRKIYLVKLLNVHERHSAGIKINQMPMEAQKQFLIS